MQAVRRIQATPDFCRKATSAASAYHRQRQQARAAVELVRQRYNLPAGQAFEWMHRPDVQQVSLKQYQLAERLSKTSCCISHI